MSIVHVQSNDDEIGQKSVDNKDDMAENVKKNKQRGRGRSAKKKAVGVDADADITAMRKQ